MIYSWIIKQVIKVPIKIYGGKSFSFAVARYVKKVKTCPNCHKEKPADEVYSKVNPYIEELTGDIVHEVMCDDCYHDACMDI